MKSILMIAAILSTAAQAQLPELEVVWERDIGDAIGGSPVLYPSMDKPEGLIVTNTEGTVYRLDRKGEIVWEHVIDGLLLSTTGIGDLDGDGVADVVAGTRAGLVVAISGSGQRLWTYQLVGRIEGWRDPITPDLDGDGVAEVLIGDDAGWLTCLSGAGKRLWRTSVDAFRVGIPAVADINGDGTLEIVHGTENERIVALDRHGKVLWARSHEGQFGRSAPTMGDLDGDGLHEILITPSFNTPNSRVICLNAEDGSLKWEAPMNLHAYVGNAILDLDGDGANEAMVWNRGNRVYVFNADGTERWSTLTGGRAYFHTGIVADLTGDGRCEVFAGVRGENEQGDSWFILDDTGEVLGRYPIKGGANIPPIATDYDGDGRMDVVMCGKEAGVVRCITFGGPATGRVAWATHRVDAARTGAVPIENPKQAGAYPEGPDPVSLTPTDAAWGPGGVQMPSAVAQDLHVMSVRDPHSRWETKAFGPSTDGAIRAAYDLAGAGNHLVEHWSVPASTALAKLSKAELKTLGSASTYLVSLNTDLKAIGDTANRIADAAPDAAVLLGSRQVHQENAVHGLVTQADNVDWSDARAVDALRLAMAERRVAITKDRALARRAEQVALGSGSAPFTFWEDSNPWDGNRELEQESALAQPLRLKLCAGEYESRAVTLLNLRPEPITIQLRPDDIAQEIIEFYEVVRVPRSGGDWVDDALPHMNRGRTIRLGAGETRVVWLTVDGTKLEPGLTGCAIELLALGFEDARMTLTVETEVNAVNLADAPIFRSCNWVSASYLQNKAYSSDSLQGSKAHGLNVYTSGLPGRQADAEGNLIGEPSWSFLDNELELMGPDAFALFHFAGTRVPDEVEEYGPIHIKATRAYLAEVKAHLRVKGWDLDRWALYPVDEPGLVGGTLIERFRRYGELFRAADPDVQIYANPTGGMTVENMTPIAHLVDIWCPNQRQLRFVPGLAEWFVSQGKPVWSYEAAGDVKRLLPLGYYRANSWQAVQMGLTGTGFWTQMYGNDNDMWLRRDTNEWGGTYATFGDEVISRRWEAWRDGLEDARLFLWLKQLAADAKAAGTHEAAVAKAETLLQVDMPEVVRRSFNAHDITRFLRDYEMEFDEVNRIRWTAVDLIAQLQEAA